MQRLHWHLLISALALFAPNALAENMPRYELSFESMVVVTFDGDIRISSLRASAPEPSPLREDVYQTSPFPSDAPTVHHLGFGLNGLDLNSSSRWAVGLMASEYSTPNFYERFVLPFVAYSLANDWTALAGVGLACSPVGTSAAPLNAMLFHALPGRRPAYIGGAFCYGNDGLLSGSVNVGAELRLVIPLY